MIVLVDAFPTSVTVLHSQVLGNVAFFTELALNGQFLVKIIVSGCFIPTFIGTVPNVRTTVSVWTVWVLTVVENVLLNFLLLFGVFQKGLLKITIFGVPAYPRRVVVARIADRFATWSAQHGKVGELVHCLFRVICLVNTPHFHFWGGTLNLLKIKKVFSLSWRLIIVAFAFVVCSFYTFVSWRSYTLFYHILLSFLICLVLFLKDQIIGPTTVMRGAAMPLITIGRMQPC